MTIPDTEGGDRDRSGKSTDSSLPAMQAATHARRDASDQVTLFLTGDVMTGRGIDQILPHSCSPELHESYARSAIDYVRLAEEANGPISRPVEQSYIWGDALIELDRRRPGVRLVNLETAVTTSNVPQPKGINYRMHPDNMPVLTAAGLDCCTLANNHVLDWGVPGLLETLDSLTRAGIRTAGAGRNRSEAELPAMLPVAGGRVLVFAFGMPTSGIPESWAATGTAPGVNFLPDLGPRMIDTVAASVEAHKKRNDLAVVSLHWGGNWGYEISAEQKAFAHGLIDRADVDIVWGHSSHHPKAMEVHNGKLVLYGCGDFLNDYEGIRGYESFRDDLVLMYFPTVRITDGALESLMMVPLQIRNFRLHRASQADARWLCKVLCREGRKLGAGVRLDQDDNLVLE